MSIIPSTLLPALQPTLDTTLTLAWRPILDPLELTPYWWAFVVPLSLGIAVAYKAIRFPSINEPDGWARYARSVVVMTAQIIVAMILLWVAFYLFVLRLLPAIAPMP